MRFAFAVAIAFSFSASAQERPGDHLVPSSSHPLCWSDDAFVAKVSPSVAGWDSIGSLWVRISGEGWRVTRLLIEEKGTGAALEVRQARSEDTASAPVVKRIKLAHRDAQEIADWIDDIAHGTRYPTIPKGQDLDELGWLPPLDGNEYWFSGPNYEGSTYWPGRNPKIQAVTDVLFLDPSLPDVTFGSTFSANVMRARKVFAPNQALHHDAGLDPVK